MLWFHNTKNFKINYKNEMFEYLQMYHSYFITFITFIGSAFFMLGFDMFLQALKKTVNVIHMRKV